MDLPDLLLIDKPAGITSMDVIRQLRKRLNTRKMGHAGTLDPAATGLMLIGIGPGTKQLNDFIKLDKEYLAEIQLGTKTASGDLDGPVLEEQDVTNVDEQQVEKVVSSLVGEIELPVSAYSAIKVDGVPMYKRAHQAERDGEEALEPTVRSMKVLEAVYLGIREEGGKTIVTARFLVGSGTYIRSLGEEVGKQLGYPATLHSLRRTKIGIFDVLHAKQIEEVGGLSI
ncbi:MAG: tRNA pseudouridine(55) synthase TruB [Patescibacteria group bacterium]